jgi:hypothetical protein
MPSNPITPGVGILPLFLLSLSLLSIYTPYIYTVVVKDTKEEGHWHPWKEEGQQCQRCHIGEWHPCLAPLFQSWNNWARRVCVRSQKESRCADA